MADNMDRLSDELETVHQEKDKVKKELGEGLAEMLLLDPDFRRAVFHMPDMKELEALYGEYVKLDEAHSRVTNEYMGEIHEMGLGNAMGLKMDREDFHSDGIGGDGWTSNNSDDYEPPDQP